MAIIISNPISEYGPAFMFKLLLHHKNLPLKDVKRSIHILSCPTHDSPKKITKGILNNEFAAIESLFERVINPPESLPLCMQTDSLFNFEERHGYANKKSFEKKSHCSRRHSLISKQNIIEIQESSPKPFLTILSQKSD
ncbi:hypothetical protein RF11_04043 [Thelohanellus kitauei]|uniref:Uncharacterized protein n=1 Tax=Thelohanellus kitauei TaxID=669202 RepID=A0A0C2JQ45_THEKT|nr:hypothetical protein RF11_04043 [Thelohanellus kitauei]